ncbi:MAG: molybdenum cofactor biosynthesis protein MoaE [Hyphomicrobiaceae bacterium]|nr:molybdenum cofactor biosynthesis protein MoaE [Hyphomicrobiaceae bacterium]
MLRRLEGDGDVGALASFIGLCRSENGRLAALELEHYPGMAERQIEAICQKALERFGAGRIVVRHRYGLMRPGETIVLVAATSSHRRAAFQSVDFIMDFLKTDAPFWKREHPADGTPGPWVEARAGDDADRARWQDKGMNS